MNFMVEHCANHKDSLTQEGWKEAQLLSERLIKLPIVDLLSKNVENGIKGYPYNRYLREL